MAKEKGGGEESRGVWGLAGRPEDGALGWRLRGVLSALDHAADVTVSDAQGDIVYVNDRFCELSGYSREEILGRNHRLLNSGHHPESFFKDLWDTVLAGKVWTGDIRNKAKDGSHFWVATTITPLRDESGKLWRFVVIRHDITRLKNAEEALRESEARRKLAAEIGDIGMWVRELPGGRMIWDPVIRRQWGLGEGEISFERFIAAIHPEDRERVAAALEDGIRARRRWNLKYRVIRPDGATRWISATGEGFYDDEGRCFRTAGVTRDVTESVAAQAQIDRAHEHLRHAQKMESIGRLAGGIAHDFNNIMTAILGYSGLLLRDLPPDDPRRESAVEINGAGQRAAELTRQLLAFSRRQNLSLETFDLNGLVSSFAGMFSRLIPENIEMRTSLLPGPCLIKADPGQIEQALMNLCLNARDAMPDGGTLSLETSTAELGGEYVRSHPGIEPGPHAVITIQDTGRGVDPVIKERLFEPFVTTKEQGKGTGLGLATAYGMVRQNRGSIEVESSPGRGAKFTIHLPRAAESGSCDFQSAAPRPEAAPGAPAPASILLVEDDSMVRRFVCRFLRENGYQVAEAATGAEALALFERQGGAFDLLLTDVVMPGMRGDDLADRLAALSPSIKVILMSGYADQSVVDRARVAKRRFLCKPVSPADLLRELGAALAGR